MLVILALLVAGSAVGGYAQDKPKPKEKEKDKKEQSEKKKEHKEHKEKKDEKKKEKPKSWKILESLIKRCRPFPASFFLCRDLEELNQAMM